MRIGYWLNCEELPPSMILEQARLAEQAGFADLWISDHFHPWNDAQGQSAFVWSMIGALSAVCGLPVTTAVTCPTVRIHPAIIAQAAATSAVLLDGRFTLGVGSGEALNEHVTGARWPDTGVRLAMLAEAVEVIRKLWTGDFVNHHGRYYTVENARIYTLPDRPPPIYVSGLGVRSTALAARIGDGYVNAGPKAEMVRAFRAGGGGDKPATGGFKACWAPSEDEAVRISYRLWPNSGLPGEVTRVLSSPKHFEQASTLVPEEAMRDEFVCGPDPQAHLRMIETYARAGFDRVYVASIGPHHRELIRMYEREVLPRVGRLVPAPA